MKMDGAEEIFGPNEAQELARRWFGEQTRLEWQGPGRAIWRLCAPDGDKLEELAFEWIGSESGWTMRPAAPHGRGLLPSAAAEQAGKQAAPALGELAMLACAGSGPSPAGAGQGLALMPLAKKQGAGGHFAALAALAKAGRGRPESLAALAKATGWQTEEHAKDLLFLAACSGAGARGQGGPRLAFEPCAGARGS